MNRKTTKPIDGATPASKLPASQRVTAPHCPSCRHDDTFIYFTDKPKRYCKCKRCGWTWKIVVASVKKAIP